MGTKIVSITVGKTDHDPNSPKCPHKDPTKCDPQIDSITEYGVMTVLFPYQLLHPLPKTKEEFVEVEKTLKVTLLQSSTEVERVKVKWANVTEITNNTMIVLLEFTKPELVSYYVKEVRIGESK